MKRETAANFTRLAAIVGAIVALALVPAALAGQGGNGNGNGKPSDPNTAQLSFSASQASPASSVAVGQTYQIHGSGFGANAYVSVGARYPNNNIWWGGYANAQGEVNMTFTALSAGQIVHEGWERMNNGHFDLKASATLTVTG